LAVNKLSLVTS